MNTPIPGYRIGQAANLAHDYLVAQRFNEKNIPLRESLINNFKPAWMERTWQYIQVLNEMEARFGSENPQSYPKAMQQKLGMEHGGEKGIPVIHQEDA